VVSSPSLRPAESEKTITLLLRVTVIFTLDVESEMNLGSSVLSEKSDFGHDFFTTIKSGCCGTLRSIE
jgi:hypothetical protein